MHINTTLSHGPASRLGDVLRVVTVLLLAVAEIATSATSQLIDGAIDVATQAAKVNHALTPANYAFAIWGPIFAGTLAFSVWQALPRNWSHPLSRRVGWLAAGMFLINAAWQVLVPLRGLGWPSTFLLAIEPVLGAILVTRLRNTASELTTAQRWLVAVPLQVLTGWVMAAIFVGVSGSALWNGGWPLDTRQLLPSAALLTVAIAVWCWVARTSSALPLALAIVWALVAITARNVVESLEPLVAVMAVVGIVLVLAAWWSGKQGLTGSRTATI